MHPFRAKVRTACRRSDELLSKYGSNESSIFECSRTQPRDRRSPTGVDVVDKFVFSEGLNEQPQQPVSVFFSKRLLPFSSSFNLMFETFKLHLDLISVCNSLHLKKSCLAADLPSIKTSKIYSRVHFHSNLTGELGSGDL